MSQPPVAQPVPSLTSNFSSLPPSLLAVASTYDSATDDDDDDHHHSNPYQSAAIKHTQQSHASSSTSSSSSLKRSEYARRTDEFWSSFDCRNATSSTSRVIDETVVRRYVFDYGAPEKPAGLRGLLWKLFLGYLPWDRSKWRETLNKQRSTYQSFVNELTSNPFADMTGDSDNSNNSNSSSGKSVLRFSKLSAGDDPLSSSKAGSDTSWQKYYKDNSIREEIEKDVKRTYSSFHFFNQRVRPIESTPEEIKRANALERSKQPMNGSATNLFDESSLKAATTAKDGAVPIIPRMDCTAPVSKEKKDETHHDVIKRMLFIYAKLNPAIRYVQGMNELISPVYYLFAQYNGKDLYRHSPDGEIIHDANYEEKVGDLFTVETAEPDAFFVFTAIMSNMRDRFIKALDLSPTGVINTIANLNKLLMKVDVELWKHLNEIKVDPRFYSFRWLTLILSQEFELPDVN